MEIKDKFKLVLRELHEKFGKKCLICKNTILDTIVMKANENDYVHAQCTGQQFYSLKSLFYILHNIR
jgi:PP-loop superfamily ATP-utilizing enzyme